MLSSPLHLLSVTLLAISALAAPLLPERQQAHIGAGGKKITVAPVVVHSSSSTRRVEWMTDFPPALLGGSMVNLAWTGGSGRGYDLYYIPTWPGAPAELEHIPITRTSGTHMSWRVPSLDAYPVGTTIILVVRDIRPPTAPAPPSLAKRGGGAASALSWFDTSRAMRLSNKKGYREAYLAQRAFVDDDDEEYY